MRLKIFLTADVHLGMKFARYPEVQGELSEARFATLRNMVERANAEGCHMFLVAGDLFDRPTVSREAVLRAASILGEFQGGLAAVLPGNHDFAAPVSDRLWPEFAAHAGDRTVVLAEKRTYPLSHYDLDAVIYPAPCEGKHSERSGAGWVRDALRGEGRADGGTPFRIGVAHGSLMGVSPDYDQRYYPMTREELESAGLDVWLLGHTHARYPSVPGRADRIFYPGTPEPDGFDCEHEGGAWIITLENEPAFSLNAEPVATGRYRFVRLRAEVSCEEDLDALAKTFAGGRHSRSLVKLSIAGRIPKERARSVPSLENEIAGSVFLLVRPVDLSGLREEISREDIAREFTEHSFPYRLLTALADSGDQEALQLAYDMIREARG